MGVKPRLCAVFFVYLSLWSHVSALNARVNERRFGGMFSKIKGAAGKLKSAVLREKKAENQVKRDQDKVEKLEAEVLKDAQTAVAEENGEQKPVNKDHDGDSEPTDTPTISYTMKRARFCYDSYLFVELVKSLINEKKAATGEEATVLKALPLTMSLKVEEMDLKQRGKKDKTGVLPQTCVNVEAGDVDIVMSGKSLHGILGNSWQVILGLKAGKTVYGLDKENKKAVYDGATLKNFKTIAEALPKDACGACTCARMVQAREQSTSPDVSFAKSFYTILFSAPTPPTTSTSTPAPTAEVSEMQKMLTMPQCTTIPDTGTICKTSSATETSFMFQDKPLLKAEFSDVTVSADIQQRLDGAMSVNGCKNLASTAKKILRTALSKMHVPINVAACFDHSDPSNDKRDLYTLKKNKCPAFPGSGSSLIELLQTQSLTEQEEAAHFINEKHEQLKESRAAAWSMPAFDPLTMLDSIKQMTEPLRHSSGARRYSRAAGHLEDRVTKSLKHIHRATRNLAHALGKEHTQETETEIVRHREDLEAHAIQLLQLSEGTADDFFFGLGTALLLGGGNILYELVRGICSFLWWIAQGLVYTVSFGNYSIGKSGDDKEKDRRLELLETREATTDGKLDLPGCMAIMMIKNALPSG